MNLEFFFGIALLATGLIAMVLLAQPLAGSAFVCAGIGFSLGSGQKTSLQNPLSIAAWLFIGIAAVLFILNIIGIGSGK